MMIAFDIILLMAAGVGAVFLAVVARVLAEDAKTFVPRLAERLIRAAAAKINENHRDELLSEWLAHLEDIPEISGKFWHAISIYFWGARQICKLVGFSSVRPLSSRALKRTFDIVVAFLILLTMLPVFVIISVILAWQAKGPIFWKQLEIGENGQRFEIWKFRTLNSLTKEQSRQHKEDYLGRSGGEGMLPEDPLVTKFGSFLRDTEFDKIPMLINVLKGDMTMVGPQRSGGAGARPIENKEKNVRPGLIGEWLLMRWSDNDPSMLEEQKKRGEPSRLTFFGEVKMIFKIVVLTLQRVARWRR
ncbi:MAG: sugar transferase [Pseudomonadota bacterium]